MFLKFLRCWWIAFSFSVVECQEVGDSFNSESRFSNYWNSNGGFPVSNHRPFIGNTNNAGSNFFGFDKKPNENKFSALGNEKNWGGETITNIEKTSDWNPKNPTSVNNERQSNYFNNRPNKKKLNSVMNLPNSSKWDANSNSFTSNSNKKDNSGFSSWEYNNVKPSSSNQSNKKQESWDFNGISNSKGNEESDYEDNSVYSWGSNNNKKPKPTPSYGISGSRESTTQKNNINFGNSKWDANNNKKPQKGSETNNWEKNNSSQSSSNSNPSAIDTSILDELDKNDWYFGKESNYPKPPFRSTLNIDVSELWNFDKNRNTNQNSRRNQSNAKVNNDNNSNKNRRNRQTERLTERMGGFYCECVNVNLCEEEDMIITQKDANFELRPSEFTCERLTDVCCTNPKKEKVTSRNNEKETLQCGQTRVRENHFGDNIAEPGEFPWILRLEYAEINCSASLIHPKMALTAAHCITSAQPEELMLQTSVWNSNNEPPQSRIVTKIIQHPDYNERNPRNDIALLVLETPFELTDNVNTICLPVTNDRWDSTQCIIAGSRSEEIRGQDSEVLEKEIVNFLPQTECQNMMLITDLWRNYILHDSFICGLGKTTRKCTGNEGSFVICPSKKQPKTYLQIGIVSMGINCDNFGRPGIFTNVLKFLDWINQNYFELGLLDEIDIRSFK